jgi:hypothetical protein
LVSFFTELLFGAAYAGDANPTAAARAPAAITAHALRVLNDITLLSRLDDRFVAEHPSTLNRVVPPPPGVADATIA